MENKNSLKGKAVLVTGVGRVGGIGAAICRELAKNGADIFFTYWQPYDKKTHALDPEYDPISFENELKGDGIRAASSEMDLSNPSAAELLFQQAEDTFGHVDILINNACYHEKTSFAELAPEILDKHYAVNVRAVALLCKEFVKRGRAGQAGQIINMTSGQSLGSMGEQQISYTITKAALEMLVKQLAPEINKLGIIINALDPGPTDTGWMSDALKEQIVKESKKGRLTIPTDIGLLITKLLTEKTAQSGQVIYAER